MDELQREFERMTPEEAELHSGSMRDRFEEREIPWRGDYEALLGEEWPWYDGPEWNRWRLAAYIAWESCPVDGRWPGTKDDFAQLLGWSSARQLRKYRMRHPEIDALVRENVLEPLFARRARVLRTLGDLAEEHDYKTFKDRELFLKLTEVYQPSQDIHLRQSQVSADQMADAQRQAEEELREWQPARLEPKGDEEEDDPA
jgi:hypothetical protein